MREKLLALRHQIDSCLVIRPVDYTCTMNIYTQSGIQSMPTFTPCQQSPHVLQAVRITPPSLVVAAWASLRTAKVAREFLGDGVSSIRGIAPELPVVVVGGKDDGKVRLKLYF